MLDSQNGWCSDQKGPPPSLSWLSPFSLFLALPSLSLLCHPSFPSPCQLHLIRPRAAYGSKAEGCWPLVYVVKQKNGCDGTKQYLYLHTASCLHFYFCSSAFLSDLGFNVSCDVLPHMATVLQSFSSCLKMQTSRKNVPWFFWLICAMSSCSTNVLKSSIFCFLQLVL